MKFSSRFLYVSYYIAREIIMSQINFLSIICRSKDDIPEHILYFREDVKGIPKNLFGVCNALFVFSFQC
jgi:hypothetical protein